MSIPNIITSIRFLLIPLFLAVEFSDFENAKNIAAIIFIAAMLLDVLDGFVARHFDMITDIGKMLDPIADKCTMIAVSASLVYKGILSKWFLFFIVIKEIIMVIGGTFIYKKDKIVIPSNFFGKAATFLLSCFIIDCVCFEVMIEPFLILVVAAMVIAFFTYVYEYIKQKKGIDV